MERDVRDVAYNPAVVWYRRDIKELPGPQLKNTTVVKCGDGEATQDHSNVLHSAAVRADGRPYVEGPAPSRLMDHARDLDTTKSTSSILPL